MTDFDFLLKLRNSGIVLRSEGDRLICNAPKGALTPELRSMLKEQKDEILELIRQAEKTSSPPVPPITKTSFNGRAPMSFGQQRLWFLEQLQPGNSAYNMSWALRIRGGLQAEALEKSLNEVVKRHDVLRTTFAFEDGRPVQVIAPSLWVPIAHVGFETPSFPNGEDDGLARILQEEARRPFDFNEGPLLRASLFRIDARQFVFFFAIHHMLFDGWSFDILMTELFSFYAAFASGHEFSPPALPVQYADYAHWQQTVLPQEHLAGQLAYWKEKLAGVAPATLALDYPRPALQSFEGVQETMALPQNLADDLKKLARIDGGQLSFSC